MRTSAIDIFSVHGATGATCPCKQNVVISLETFRTAERIVGSKLGLRLVLQHCMYGMASECMYQHNVKAIPRSPPQLPLPGCLLDQLFGVRTVVGTAVRNGDAGNKILICDLHLHALGLQTSAHF